MGRQAERRRWLLLAGATLAVFLRWAPGLGPVPFYDSDVAVPLLTANGEGSGAFLLYYPLQDRLGGWPTLLARALLPLVGPWSPHGLHVLTLVLLLSAVFPASRLGGAVSGLAYLLACAWPSAVAFSLSYPQPYGAQLATLLWAWWALRRASDARSLGWAAAAAAFATLSCWTSPSSGPLLAALVGAELLRAGALRRLEWGTAFLLLVPALAGALGEGLIRIAYHQAMLAAFGRKFGIHVRLDWGHLWDNSRALLEKLAQTGAVPLVAVGLLAGALAAVWLLRRAPGADALAWLFGTALASAVSWLLIVCINHVRLNAYNPRYLAPAIALASMAAWSGAGLALCMAVRRLRPAWSLPGLAVLAGAVALGVPPASGDVPPGLRATAEALGAEAPGSVLLADYWTCYALSALVPRGVLEPLPAEGEMVRLPWKQQLLPLASRVVVGSRGKLARRPGAPPPSSLCQYGVRLELVQAELPVPGEERFALYTPNGRCN
jgi:hypothetical protein